MWVNIDGVKKGDMKKFTRISPYSKKFFWKKFYRKEFFLSIKTVLSFQRASLVAFKMKTASPIWNAASVSGSFSLLFLLLLLPLFLPLSPLLAASRFLSANVCWAINIFSGKQELYLVLITGLILESTYKTPFLVVKISCILGWIGEGLALAAFSLA